MSDAPRAHEPSILLVEDDEQLVAILERHLRARGYAVESREDVASALAALRGGLRPAVVLLDINLPDAAGWAIARSPELAGAGSPPVVVVSAVTVSPSRLAEAGVAGYLPKPFPLETLMAVIERHTPPAVVAADAGDPRDR